MVKQYKCSQCLKVEYFVYELTKAFMFVCKNCGRIYFIDKRKEGSE